MRSLFVGATTAAAFALLLSACPHPDGDYEDFLEDTKAVRTGQSSGNTSGEPGDGGQTIDAEVPIEAQEGTYLAACLASLSGTRADKALRFYAETKFVPGVDGTGTLGLILYPFPVANTTFDKAVTVGAPIDVGQLPVTAQATFSGTVARSDITKEANTISPRDIEIQNTQIAGIFAATGNFCSSFNTTVTKPITQSIIAKCTYVPLKTGDTYEVVVPTGDSTRSAIVAGGVELTPDKFGCAN